MEAKINWDEHGLVPTVVQDGSTEEVLMLAYMNAAALARTLDTGEAWFWSRSRQELWHKGATSGNRQRVLELRYDCDADALLLRVEPRGPACHSGQRSCFHRHLVGPTETAGDSEQVLRNLWATIQDRKAKRKEHSYTCQLLAGDASRLLKKVGEEAIEVIVAAQGEGDGRLVSEVADLTYHLLVLLAARDLSWADVEAELGRRFRLESTAGH